MWFKKKWLLLITIVIILTGNYFLKSWQKIEVLRAIAKFEQTHESWYNSTTFSSLSYLVVRESALYDDCENACISTEIFKSTTKLYAVLYNQASPEKLFLVLKNCRNSNCIKVPNSEYFAERTDLLYIPTDTIVKNDCDLTHSILVSFSICRTTLSNKDNLLQEKYYLFSRGSLFRPTSSLEVRDSRRPSRYYSINHDFHKKSSGYNGL